MKFAKNQLTPKTFNRNKVFDENFILIKNQRSNNHQTLIVISKKVVKKAVDRNRIKRVIREALRSLKTEEPKLKVIVKKNIAHYKMSQVRSNLENLTNKISFT